ncbi:MAG: IS200/IS605 family transposase [Verrucomicrobiota bacterium]
MPRTYTQLLSHIVFSTKERRPMLAPELGVRLFAYMGGIIRQLDGVSLLINGVADHVHILASLPATIAPSEFVGKLKANSSRWVHENFPEHRRFAWQLGYSAFSVSVSQKQGVLDYIAGQEEHHRKVPYQEELIAFLKKHEIEYDERYVFE